MSKIKVYVRVRPALPGEFDAPGCFNCTELEDVSGNWIQIKKEGEQKRNFSRVWGPQSTQEEVFRTIGINTVSDVLEGYYGCVFVYGQTGTGKTFTLGCTTPGLEGIQPRCIQYLFERIAKESERYEVTVKQQYIQIYRDNVQDLLDIAKDNLMVRVDEKGATIEGVTTRDVHSYQESIALVREGDGNRSVANTKMNSASSRSHACLITEVYRKEIATGNQTFGRLYLIDLAGSERVSKSGVTGDAYKEAVAINQSLTTLGNCVAGLVAGEKVISFRDSKLTRILQHSLSGNGRTSIVVTIRPDSPNMQETLCTLKFGERAQKVQTQMTPAGFRDQLLEISEKVAENERISSDGATGVRVNKKWSMSLEQRVAQAQNDLAEASKTVNAEVEQLQSQHVREKDALRQAAESEKKRSDNAAAVELEQLRTANASVLKQVEDKVADSERIIRDKQNKESKGVAETLAKLKAENDALTSKLNAMNADEGPDFNAIAAEKIATLREKMNVVKRKLKGCRESKNEGLPLHELMDRIEVRKTARGKLRAKCESLEARTQGWKRSEMEREFPHPEPEALSEYWTAIADAPEEEDDEAPPSSEPPPTDTDASSSDSDSSAGSSTSESSSSASSDESEDEDDNAAKKVDLAELQMNGPQVKKRPTMMKESIPRKQFDHAVMCDVELSKLLDQIVEYLEYGCLCYILNGKVAPCTLHKRHMFISGKKSDDMKSRSICITEVDESGQPDRTAGREIMQLSEITDLVLGQFSQTFRTALEGAPIVAQGTVMPPTSSKITLSSLAVFFYRSMTIFNHDVPVVDVIFNNDTDFEAWLVTIHRLTFKDPHWGGPLDLSTFKETSKLSDDEKKFCSTNHVLPVCLLLTKSNVLHKAPRVFQTLYDIRSVANLDMLHSQKIFEFFISQGYFQRVNAYQLRYLEILQIEAEEKERKAKKEALRKLRLRIGYMMRKYRPDADTAALGEFLASNEGKEQSALEELVATHGPEPEAAEVAAQGWNAEVIKQLHSIDEERKRRKEEEAATSAAEPPQATTSS